MIKKIQDWTMKYTLKLYDSRFYDTLYKKSAYFKRCKDRKTNMILLELRAYIGNMIIYFSFYPELNYKLFISYPFYFIILYFPLGELYARSALKDK